MLVILSVGCLFLPRFFAASCYQCASELALINWSRYGLPPSQGDSMIADDACLENSHLTSRVPCNAPCMTVNITAVGGRYDGRVIAVVRDCQNYFLRPKSLPEGTDRLCRHRERDVRHHQRINVTFCYCEGHLCNGRAPPEQYFRSAHRRHPRLPGSSVTVRLFSSGVILMVLAFVLG